MPEGPPLARVASDDGTPPGRILGERGGICCCYSLGAPHAAPADAARLCDSPGSRALPQSRARARSSNRTQHCVCYRKKFPVLKFRCARFEVWLDILRCAKASEPAGEDAPEATEDVGPQSNAAVEPSSVLKCSRRHLETHFPPTWRRPDQERGTPDRSPDNEEPTWLLLTRRCCPLMTVTVRPRKHLGRKRRTRSRRAGRWTRSGRRRATASHACRLRPSGGDGGASSPWTRPVATLPPRTVSADDGKQA